MKYQVTVETAIIIIKYGAAIMSCWPLATGSSRLVILQHNVRVYITIVNMAIFIEACFNTMYEYRDDAIRMVKVASETSALVSTFTKIIICQAHAPRIQGLIAQMETFLKQATENEKELIQGYVDKCLLLHLMVLLSAVTAPLAFIAGPLMTSQPFPGDTVYPFPTESTWVWATLYISQSVCVIQAGSMIFTDVMFTMLLWYAGARFHMLSLALREATNADEVDRCIQQHQELIRYVDELMIIVRCIAVEVSIGGLFKVTSGGYILIGVASALELLLFAWPADHLIEVSESVGHAAYDCRWIGKPPGMLKNILFVIQRSRNPLVISVNGILPVLSLEFYGSTMAATFSYITTLRALTAD